MISGTKKNLNKLTKLHLGCGKKHFTGWLNVDKQAAFADFCFDFEKFPWPLPSSHFEEVYCCHVLEHLRDVQKTMDEIWRICKNNAKVTIIVPHFSGVAAPSPFHWHCFNSQSMNYFTALGIERYGKASFEILSTRIFWYPESADKEYVNQHFKRKVGKLAGRIIDAFINQNQRLFERVWHGWVGGAFEIMWEMKAKK